jgi:subtilisin family serine protease
MEPGYSIETINTAFGTTVKGFAQQTECYLLATQMGQNPESLAVIISEVPGVQYCGANYYLDAPEPFQRSQPFLDAVGEGEYETQLAASTLDLPTAQTISEGSGVTVAVIDGGINFDHPEFSARSGGVYSGWDYVDNDADASDEPGGIGSGHGTFIAGIVKLVSPGCSIYAYRVLDTLGRGDGFAVTTAVLRAVEDGCKVINLSLGMLGQHEALDDALRYAESRDVVVVAAAGNDNIEADVDFPFPAKRIACLAVAAVDSMNIKADFSNFGHRINVCAPGTQIYSPFLGDFYAWWDGTSFAAPFVSGLAALMLSVDSTLGWDEVQYVISETATNIDSLNPGLEGKLGGGLVNPTAALEMVVYLSCGDVDASHEVSISDLTYMVEHFFGGGPAPCPGNAGDLDCSGTTDISDLSYLVAYVFQGGPSPCEGCQ